MEQREYEAASQGEAWTIGRYQAMAQAFLDEMANRELLPAHPDDVSASMRGEMAVLRLLDQKKRRITAGEISRLLNMTTPRIAAVLNSLERKGMIERGGDANDRRRVLVTLTEQGNACCRAKREAVIGRLAEIFEAIGPEDTETFVRLMQKVMEAAVRLRESGGMRESPCETKTPSPRQGGKAL